MQRKTRMRKKTSVKLKKGDGCKAAPSKERVIAGLRCVTDPHTNINVYDMGLVSDLQVGDEVISMTFRPTSPFCPLAFDLARSMMGEMWELGIPGAVRVTVVGHYQEDNINKALKALAPKKKVYATKTKGRGA